MANQYEGSAPPGHKAGAKPTSGTGTIRLHKQRVTPTPSDKGSSGNGKG